MDSSGESEKRETRKTYYILAISGYITVFLVAPVVLCLVLGLWLDSFLHTTPLFVILGVIIGFAGSIINVFKVMEIINKL
jgi:F0F1-type ATP synthase assembly protein I